MSRPKTLLATIALLTVGALSGASAASASSLSASKATEVQAASTPTIVIGSTNFSEQVIVANLYSDVLQHAGSRPTCARTWVPVKRSSQPWPTAPWTSTRSTRGACSCTWSQKTRLRPPSSPRPAGAQKGSGRSRRNGPQPGAGSGRKRLCRDQENRLPISPDDPVQLEAGGVEAELGPQLSAPLRLLPDRAEKGVRPEFQVVLGIESEPTLAGLPDRRQGTGG